MKVIVDYPTMAEEQLILKQQVQGQKLPTIKPVISIQELSEAKLLAREVYMDEKIERYILEIVFATRKPADYNLQNLKPLIAYGGSPRATINLALAAKAHAYLQNRAYVIPEDVRSICMDVLRHRIGLSYEAEAENVSITEVVQKILDTISVP